MIFMLRETTDSTVSTGSPYRNNTDNRDGKRNGDQ